MSQTSLPPTPDDEPDFVNEDEAKKNRCLLHGGVLRNAVQTVCGHRFCEACIGPLLAAGVMCPANEEDCVWLSLKEENESPIHPDFSTRREVLNLKVYCQFKQFGCKTVTTWRQLQKHVESCEHRRTSCTNGCGQSIPVASLSSHLTDECERRMVDCKHCGESVVFSHQQSHWDKECPEMKISCPNNCKSKKFKRRQLSAHLKTCPNKPKKCRFSGAGCTFEARSVAEMDDHERDGMGMHMGLMAEQTAQLTLKLQEVRPQNNQENAVEVERLRNDNKMLQVRVVTLTERTINLENQFEELKRKMALDAEKFNSQLEAVQATMLVNDQRAMEGQQPVTALSGATTDVNKRLQRVEQQVDIHEIRLAEGDLRFQIIETTNYHGILMWKIKDYRKRKQEAINRKTLSLFSQPFYSDQFGYKMCARVYLNGDGIGKNTHLSLFFVVMRGEYDNLLPWPFRNKVTMMLLDQESGRSPLVDSFRPDPSSSSFQKPTSEMNVASGCPVFISHVNLETGPFLKEDAIYIKVMVDAHA